MNTNYSVKIAGSSRELTAVERISIKDISDTIPLGELKADENIILKPDFYAILDVHNEKAENKDYRVFVIQDKDGKRYSTSSESFWNSFENIMDEIEDEKEDFDYSIKVFCKPSKNYKGKTFLTCNIA